MVVASICTIPERKESFLCVLHNILEEQTYRIDRVHVWLNGYSALDSSLPQNERIVYHLEPQNKGPWIRLTVGALETEAKAFITLDDDLSYPNTYVADGLERLFDGDSRRVVTFGGIVWDYAVSREYLSYHGDRLFFGLHSPIQRAQVVALPLGALTFYHPPMLPRKFDFQFGGFRTNDDMFMGWHLQRNGYTIEAQPAKANWVRVTEVSQKEHALSIRDRKTRHRTFRYLIDKLGFDPTAGKIHGAMRRSRRILVAAGSCPAVDALCELDHVLSKLAGEDTSLHVICPVPVSKAPLVECGSTDSYAVHRVAMPENTGRFQSFPMIAAFRSYRVRRTSDRLWKSRVSQALKAIRPTELLSFQSGNLHKVESEELMSVPS